MPNAKLVAISDVSEESARKAALEMGDGCRWFTDYREALAQSGADAVIVTTPTKYHHEIVLAAAAAASISCARSPWQ
jgi:myo-inositol 2-dehydrogenase/D-chiro-inositol 1-dehydrogenase/scyllo-inositol 2-dehydrogenase (NAD+)